MQRKHHPYPLNYFSGPGVTFSVPDPLQKMLLPRAENEVRNGLGPAGPSGLAPFSLFSHPLNGSGQLTASPLIREPARAELS